MRLIPTKKQFKNWSLPSKIAYIALPITVVLAVIFFIIQLNIGATKNGQREILSKLNDKSDKRPFLRISYHEQETSVIILFENIGDTPANYFTADIRAEKGAFKVDRINANFELKASGESGNWTIISGKDILPLQRGSITLIKNKLFDEFILEPPVVKSDSEYEFAGTMKWKFGPIETYKEK
ncbi:MAG: hypothetical protein JXJ19_07340 [Elusimicrobia bacterium]|nr:hypothetical protein [Elusimicrobiota bacterium]